MADTDNKIEAKLYDASGSDEMVQLDSIDPAKLNDNQLLWVNVLARDPDLIRSVLERFSIKGLSVHSLEKESRRPHLENYDDHFRFCIDSVKVSKDGKPERQQLDLIVSKNLVITIHDDRVDYFDEFQKREKGETRFGELNAESFVATLLDLHIVTYYRALEAIEGRIDVLDAKVLKTEIQTDQFLADISDLRKDIAKLRRWLLPHRDIFYAFTRPDFQQIAESGSTGHYALLNQHFDSAVDAIEHSRETVLGSFDLYATKSSQLTNTFIQRLTVITMIIGAMGVIAGVMGMNYKVEFFDAPNGFWVTITGMAVIAIAIAIFAKIRNWI